MQRIKSGSLSFENPFEKSAGPISDISYFLTGIYNGLKGLNIPVSFSLSLSRLPWYSLDTIGLKGVRDV